MYHLLFAAAAITALSLSASARSLTAIYFRGPENAPKQVYLNSPAGSFALPLPRTNLGGFIKIPAGDLTLQVTLEAPGKDHPLPANAPTVSVPAAWTDVILLFAHNPKDPVFPFVVSALNTSLSNFKPGEMLFFNRTDTTIGGKIGDRTLKVAPGQSAKIESPVTAEGDYPVSIGYVPAGAEKAKPLALTSWRHEAAVRQLFFILPETDRGIPRIWSVSVPSQVAETPQP
ncbi:hypothetical protein HQ447_09005 [bacterium]|nr:hypothetical protein [bacterium]